MTYIFDSNKVYETILSQNTNFFILNLQLLLAKIKKMYYCIENFKVLFHFKI